MKIPYKPDQGTRRAADDRLTSGFPRDDGRSSSLAVDQNTDAHFLKDPFTQGTSGNIPHVGHKTKVYTRAGAWPGLAGTPPSWAGPWMNRNVDGRHYAPRAQPLQSSCSILEIKETPIDDFRPRRSVQRPKNGGAGGLPGRSKNHPLIFRFKKEKKNLIFARRLPARLLATNTQPAFVFGRTA